MSMDGEGESRSRFLLRQKTFERVNEPEAHGSVDRSREVRAILEDVARISSARDKPLASPLRQSRRTRDYLTILLSGNALLVGLVALLPKNPMVLVFGFSGIVVFTVGVTWVMWAVMDDY